MIDTRSICLTLASCLALGVSAKAWARDISSIDLSSMSIEELTRVQISSVSKKKESLLEAPAAVYVITHEDIRRSGAQSLPEVLRLAPNLQVARVDASQYAISARGFNSTTANKLLVLIDGRSVYTPLYSGVFWDVQNLMLEDVERIEVVSGPGGTLWGSNAVNGVINVITRHARETSGVLAGMDVGTEERGAVVRFGKKLSDQASFRVFAKGFDRDGTKTALGANVNDSWQKGQIGFRSDWQFDNDTVSLQGESYRGTIDQTNNGDKKVSGSHVLGKWQRVLSDRESVEIQSYYDRARRIYPGTFGEVLETYDLQAQHRFPAARDHDIVWGGAYRLMRDTVGNSATLAFLPARRDLKLASLFVQDSIELSTKMTFIVGAQIERNSYTGWEFQPNMRLSWKPHDNSLIWSAVSRAVRTPSRLDRELFSPGNPPYSVLAGGPDFVSEKVTAYELGYRTATVSGASWSASVFYNDYDKLRSLETRNGGFPYVIANKMEGRTYGVELWGSRPLSDTWRLVGGYSYLEKRLRLKADSNDVTGVSAAGNDPRYQWLLRSSMNLPRGVEFDVSLRRVGSLPSPHVPGYLALDTRLGWWATKEVEVSFAGFNLLDRRHPEFGNPATRSELARRFDLKVVWRY